MQTIIDEPIQEIEQQKMSESFPCPAIVGKAKSPERDYYFENRRQPGVSLEFCAGNARVKGSPVKDTDFKPYKLEHGTRVKLTEEMAEHIRSKGTMRPIQEDDNFGMKSGPKKYLDRRFDLHDV